MSKVIILIMHNTYPFGSNPQSNNLNVPIKIRQTFQVNEHNRQSIMSKITFARNLKNRFLIRVDSVLEERDSIHLMFEYVDHDFVDFNLPENQSRKITLFEHLQELGKYFSNIGIRVELAKERIGLNSQGSLKYFMGLDFTWEDNPDESYLRYFYRNSINKLVEGQVDLEKYFHPGKTSREYGKDEESQEKEKQRKSSFATLPSRFNRWKKLDQKLSTIKASVKGYSPENNISSLQAKARIVSAEKKENSPVKFSRRGEDRKYSTGDLRFTPISHRLHRKETDSRSEFGYNHQVPISKSVDPPADPSETATKKSKSRIEEMKHREYQQLTKNGKNYLSDFISVLEDEPPEEDKKAIKTPVTDSLYNSVKEFSPEKEGKMIGIKAKDLQQKAKQSIKNSKEVIKKFKQLQLKG